jgi:hypothetical protein
MRSTHLVCGLLVTIMLSLTTSAQKLDMKSLRDILSKQGFTGLLQGKVTFALLGDMKCNSRMLHVYYYTWEESEPHAAAIHFSQRLIFIDNQNYVGQYVVSDRPVLVKPDSLRFPVSEEDGDSLRCDQDGLPKTLVLDGESRIFFR